MNERLLYITIKHITMHFKVPAIRHKHVSKWNMFNNRILFCLVRSQKSEEKKTKKFRTICSNKGKNNLFLSIDTKTNDQQSVQMRIKRISI